MTKNIIEQKYFERIKNMNPEKKIGITLELEDLILDIARENIRNKFPDSDEKFVKQKLRQRLMLKEKLEKSWTKKNHLLRQFLKNGQNIWE